MYHLLPTSMQEIPRVIDKCVLFCFKFDDAVARKSVCYFSLVVAKHLVLDC